MNTRATGLRCLAAAIAIALATVVQATPNETAQRQTGTDTQSTPAASAINHSSAINEKHKSAGKDEDQTTLPPVVVTAAHRRESLQNVAGGVTSLEGSFLEQIHAHSFDQFANFVPGLSYDTLSPTSNLVAIRGVTTGGSQLSSGIGLYLDQVPIGASSPFGVGFQTLPINTFDLSRVEVLNGPQGTLYGANALGGAIKYVPATPDLDAFDGWVTAGVSSTTHAGTNDHTGVMLNLPLAPGKVALRVDGVQQYDTGFGHNILRGVDNQGAAHTFMGRAQLLAQFNPDLNVKLSAFSQRIHGDGLNVDFRDINTGAPITDTYEQQFGLAQPESNSLRMFSGIVNWNLHWATLTSVTAYQNNNGRYLTDVSDIYNPLLASVFGPQLYGLFVDTSTRKYTQELRLASPDDGRLQWLLGLYSTHEKTHEFVNLQNGSESDGLLFGYSPFYGVLPSIYQEWSAFADVTYHFTDKFDLTLGTRHSWNRQRYQQFAYGLFVVPSQPTLTTHEDATSKQNVTTYLINPRYRISRNVMVYAKIASGYRPGGPNFILQLGQGAPTFEPDKLWNYELGEKATFLDDRATLDADVYDIRWSRIQLTVNNGGINQIENGGDAQIKGAEVSAAFKLTRRLTVRASGAYTDAKLTSAVPALGLSQSGNRLPLSPKYKLSVAATYDFDIGSQSSGDFTVSDAYIGDRTTGFIGSLVTPGYRLPGYNSMNLDLAIFAPHGIEVDAFVHNAFDKAGQVSASTTANEYDPTAPVPVVLSQPRTIGVQMKMAFGDSY